MRNATYKPFVMKLLEHRYFSFMCIFSSRESPSDGHAHNQDTCSYPSKHKFYYSVVFGHIARFRWQRGKPLTGMRDLTGRNGGPRCHNFSYLAVSRYTCKDKAVPPCPRHEGMCRIRGITPCIIILGPELSNELRAPLASPS
jgi:hypothetical protein